MNIPARIKKQAGLAEIYAKDGAMHSAARVLHDLANEVADRARVADAALARFMGTAPSIDDEEVQS